MEDHTYSWLEGAFPTQARAVDIKVESALEPSVFPLLSPPSSPRSASTEFVAFSGSDSSRRHSNTSAASPKRLKPYPILTRDLYLREEHTGTMANIWSPPGSKGGSGRAPFSVEQTSPNQRSSDGGQQVSSSYGLSNTFATQSFSGRNTGRSRAPSSTSSLTGAMGDTHLSSHSEDSESPSPTDSRAFSMQGVAWTPNQHHTHTHFGAIPEQSSNSGNMPYHGLTSTSTGNPSATPYLQYQSYSQSTYSNPTAQSLSPRSSAFPASSYSDQQPFAPDPARPPSSMQHRAATPSAHSEAPMRQRPSRPTQEQFEDEIRHLRKKVRELELINESARLRQKDLEMELANNYPASSQGIGSSHGLPSPILTPSPQSSTFQASWKARTDARIRQFCSLNRAGNALCAWHDSRRERRAYPPRMAPPGHLNCGCTYEEALFEESLSRHGVGSYHPGESVRMDPALRNPLLKVLRARYGYRDGDFERDVATGNWVEGEGHVVWERKAIAGASSTRKNRGEE